MSTVCYCGQPDCPVTTWEHDACVANLRAERDALKAQLAEAVEVVRWGVEALEEAQREGLLFADGAAGAEFNQNVKPLRAFLAKVKP